MAGEADVAGFTRVGGRADVADRAFQGARIGALGDDRGDIEPRDLDAPDEIRTRDHGRDTGRGIGLVSWAADLRRVRQKVEAA
ncbi:MAG: hypothetical protein A2W00_03110 [Candidatus Eisenbacteria bacterium RBG_16_71_46]|nr:MAG: hypothetical protein A2W00_03110 [Candidatus Eisenbacteria bacterium RBG_16_71_46]